MSEQPISSANYVLGKEGTRFDDSDPDAGFDLHRNVTVPNWNPENIANTRDQTTMREPTLEELTAMAIRDAGVQLSNLQVVRSEHGKSN